jgi:cytochrome c2
VLTTPFVAWAIHGLAIWLWHAPRLYEAAVEHESLHALEHATFVGTAVLFWWGILYGRYGRAAYGASVLYVFTLMVHTGVLGAIFALSTAPFFPVYQARASAAAVDPLVDQQLAGLFMWIPSGIVLTVAGLALLFAWIAESDRRATARRQAGLTLLVCAVLAGAASCRSIPDAAEAQQLTGGDPYRGRDRIRQYGCDSCHTIPGIPTADATVGPPLTQVARRVYLAGRLENTPENMMRWVQHPQAVEPGTAMPDMAVTDADGRDIVAYLYTLR